MDLSKFRKSVTKSIPGISSGFRDPKIWISTGSYALNYRLSGNFKCGIPLGKVSMFAGPSGAGKSLIVSGNVVKNAQDQGIFVVLMDSENALDETWLKEFEIDTSEDKLIKFNVSLINDVAKLTSSFVKEYRNSYMHLPEDERPKVLFVMDSIGMLNTPIGASQFESGDLKGDLGHKAKQLKALITQLISMLADLDIGFVCTNHTYASQDMYNPDPKISGGEGLVYAASMAVVLKNSKLKEDEDGNKISSVAGIKVDAHVVKSRYSKPFEHIKINVPYSSGIDPYSGLFDMFLDMGLLEKRGHRYAYIDKDGVEHLYYRKDYNKNKDGIMDLIMSNVEQRDF